MSKVEQLMKSLGCTEQEAQEIITSDQEVDKMSVRECESDLTQIQKSAIKKFRQADRKPTVYKLDTRAKKADVDKRHLIDLLNATLGEVADQEPVVINAERQVDFVFKGRKMRIVLSAPRT